MTLLVARGGDNNTAPLQHQLLVESDFSDKSNHEDQGRGKSEEQQQRMQRGNPQFVPGNGGADQSLAIKSLVAHDANERGAAFTNNSLHTVTYASHGGRDDRFCRTVESAIREGHDLVILGWGEKWKGLSQKLSAAYDYALSLPPQDVILFTDAFDVLFQGA